MTILTLNLDERLALAILLAEADGVAAMPDEGQEQHALEKNVSTSLVARLEQLADDATYEQALRRARADPEIEARLAKLAKQGTLIEVLIGQGLTDNLASGSLRLVPVERAQTGDYCVVPCMELASAIVYLRLAHPEAGSSMRAWLPAGRELRRQFALDASGALFRKVVEFIKSKHPGGAQYVQGQQLLIIENIFAHRAIMSSDLGSMLQSGELVAARF